MRIWIAIILLFAAASLSAGEPVVEDIAFQAKVDGTEQRYVRILPADFKFEEKHDVLICLHGHGSDRWQFVKQSRDECRSARDVAAKHRMILISPDYRAKTSWMGPKATADLVQIIGEVKSQYKVGHVIVSGGSMGGFSSLAFAALHPELTSAVMSMNGTANVVEYGNFLNFVAESYGGSKQAVPDEYKRRSAELWPERLAMPIACTTGGRDTLVPPQSVQRLINALEKMNRKVLLIHREQGGHSTNYADAVEAYEFVIKQLAE